MNHSIQIEGRFFERLAIARDTLSPTMLRVARFVEGYYVDAAFMSKRTLADAAEVSLFAKGTIRDFVGSLSAPGALINCVVSELGRRLGDSALSRPAAAEEAARHNGIYGGGGPLKSSYDWSGSLLRGDEADGQIRSHGAAEPSQ